MEKPTDDKPYEPWFPFYGDDWFGDEELSALDLEDAERMQVKGFWIDVMWKMHKIGVPYGYLSKEEGVPISEKWLAKHFRYDLEITSLMLTRLVDLKIASVTEQGVIYCRKMVRDRAKRDKKVAAWEKGWESTCSSKRSSKRSSTCSSKRSSKRSSTCFEFCSSKRIKHALDMVMVMDLEIKSLVKVSLRPLATSLPAMTPRLDAAKTMTTRDSRSSSALERA